MKVWLIMLIILVLLRIVFIDFSNKKNQKYYLILSSITIILVMSLRYPEYEQVYDLKVYYNSYTEIGKTPWEALFNTFRFEPAYLILNKLLYLLCPWGQVIYIVYSTFSVFCISRFIYKNSNEPFLAIIFYVTLGGMIFQLTAFRQSIAMGFCLLSIEYILQNKKYKFLFLYIIAILFHKSAIVFILLYFLINRKITFVNNSITIILLIAAPALSKITTYIANLILDMDYNGYIGNKFGGVVPILIYLIVILMTFVFKGKIRNVVGVNMVIIGLFFYLMRYTTLAIERASFYFTVGCIIAIPEVISSINNSKLRYLIKYIAVLLALILFFKRANESDFGQYRFFWE